MKEYIPIRHDACSIIIFYSTFIDLVGLSSENENSTNEEYPEFLQIQNAIASNFQEKM